MISSKTFFFPAVLSAMLFTVGLFTSCKPKPLFQSLSTVETGITFANNLEKKKLFNILYYLYYYNGGGVSVGDINNDGLPDIFFTANSNGHNKLYLNKGNFKFEDITEQAGVAGTSDWCTGATMADVNGDGLLDIYVSAVANKYGLKGGNELFINNGNNRFTEKSKEFGLNFSGFTTQTAFFDYDHDGDLDCYVLNQSHHPHENIVDTAYRKQYDAQSGDRFYRNDLSTTGRFTDVSKEAGIYQSNLGYGLGIAVADFNNDGWDDVYIGNDFHENDYYYLNNGRGGFSDSGAAHFGHYSRFSMGNDAADYNNDGQIDLVTVDMLPPDEKTVKTYGSDENPEIYRLKLEMNGYQQQFSRNCLQRNNGNGKSFSDVALLNGVSATDWSWCPLFADFDNDGKKDLFVSSGIVKRPVDLDYIRFASNLKGRGMDRTDKFDDEALNAMPGGESHPFLFRNTENGFEDVSGTWGTEGFRGCSTGAAYADLDGDGDLELVVNCLNAPALILQNNAPQKSFINIVLKGEGGNRFGVGAKAYVFSKSGLQYQQLMASRGFQSSSELKLHFGLDTQKFADSVLIVWPDQRYQLLKRVETGRPITVLQTDARDTFRYKEFFPEKRLPLTEVNTNVNWQHQENAFSDFDVQYLIPHKQSTRGPKIAVGDVNGDSLQDMYVCGAKGQAGELLIQQANGSLIPSDTVLFKRFAECEEVDAVFFDANGDAALDLWVVSGGNQMQTDGFSSADRLFMNDGKGHFIHSPKSIPKHWENKSCVSVADVDHDGDQDVFVGFLSDPRNYGLPQHSYLYLNDGKGVFSTAPVTTINLLKIGMVTSAAFTDLNNDGWPDLTIAGEWMPIKVFLNTKGRFEEKDINASTGLWQCLYPADVNGDGLMDLLTGNWGHNTKLWSGKDGPCKLYVSDFDRNASIDQIMCYTYEGKEYTFLAKDELERSLPVLKKHYLTYGEVAGKTVDYIFDDLFKGYTELKAEVLGSSAFINDGRGNFTRVDLPAQMQLSPIMAFTTVSASKQPVLLAAGNFWGTIPYEGRYDAQPPTAFTYDEGKKQFHILWSMSDYSGEVRDLKWVAMAGGKKLLAMAHNNDSIRFYSTLN